MALFQVRRGLEENLPTSLNDGVFYFCIDTGNIYVDLKNDSDDIERIPLNSKYAYSIRGSIDGEYIEFGVADIAELSKHVNEFGNYAHQHSNYGALSNITQEKIDYWDNIINGIYPVGSIYTSIIDTNPSILFGGMWERIEGKFLFAADSTYTAGTTGGEIEHTITVDELPTHSHNATTSTNGAHSHQIGTDKDVSYSAGGACWSVHNTSSGAAYVNGYTSSSGNHSHTLTTDDVGGNLPHNNMPPFISVYMWVRTS